MADLSFAISLRIFHPTMAAEAIEQKLGMKAKVTRSVGKPRATPRGQILEGINKDTYCSFALIEKESGDFVDGISGLIPRFIAHESYFNQITREGGRVEFYVGVFAEASTGFSLAPQVMASLEKLHLHLSVEIYC